MYVILHELAHLCNYDNMGNPIQGHGLEFKNIFKLLVIEAIRLNLYEYIDYSDTPHEYCGIMISTTILPRFEYNFHMEQ
jgi:predicted SprT family Zn-dependent metalloprotease